MMNDDTQAFNEWYQNFQSRSVTEQVRFWQRYSELWQRMLSGEADDQELREEYMQFASEETMRFFRHLTTLNMRYYNAIFDLTQQYNDHLMDYTPYDTGYGEDAPTDQPQHMEIALRGKSGDQLTRTFVIENNRAQPTEIHFTMTEFSDGKDSFAAPLTIHPANFSLAPGAEQKITLQLSLEPNLFKGGQQYRGVVTVRGHDNLQLHVHVTIDPGQKSRLSVRPADDEEVIDAVVIDPAEEAEKPEEAVSPKKPAARSRSTKASTQKTTAKKSTTTRRSRKKAEPKPAADDTADDKS
jgi:hypothetical protein